MSTIRDTTKLLPKTLNATSFALGSSRFESALKTPLGKVYRVQVLPTLATNKQSKHVTLIYKPPFSVFVTSDYARSYFGKNGKQSRGVDHLVKMTPAKTKLLTLLLREARDNTDWRKFKDSYTFVARGPKIVELALELFSIDVEADEISEALVKANDAYHNAGTSLLTDAEFDAWLKFYKTNKMESPLEGVTGAPVKAKRGDKVALPVKMGSLEKVFDATSVQRWIGMNGFTTAVALPKIDGISALLEYKEGRLVNAYKRGNGTVSVSILPLVSVLKGIPLSIPNKKHMAVRAEIAMPNTVFNSLYSKANGGEYENARNLVAGVFNRTGLDKETKAVLQHCNVYPYALIAIGGEEIDKSKQLVLLNEYKFSRLPKSIASRSAITDAKLEDWLKDWKDALDVDVDGIVLEADDAKTRKRIGFETNSLNPKYARAWKPANIGVKAKVIKVEWNASRHGMLKPIIHIEPVKLSGVTVRKATGHNAANIRDNGIGPGAIVMIYRSGDVIPYVDKVVKAVKPQMPSIPYTWNSTRVDAITKEQTSSQDVQQLVHFFKTLEVEYFSEKTIEQLYAKGFKTPAKIFALGRIGLANMERMGKIAADKIFGQFDKLKDGVPAYKFMYATNVFGANFGSTKLKALVDTFGESLVNPELGLWRGKKASEVAQRLAQERGFSYETALGFAKAVPAYNSVVKELGKYILPLYNKPKAKGAKMKNQIVVFTGIRDPDTHKWIEAQGGKVGSSVSSNTTILISADPTTLKSQKAKDLGIKVLSLEGFQKKYMA